MVMLVDLKKIGGTILLLSSFITDSYEILGSVIFYLYI